MSWVTLQVTFHVLELIVMYARRDDVIDEDIILELVRRHTPQHELQWWLASPYLFVPIFHVSKRSQIVWGRSLILYKQLNVEFHIKRYLTLEQITTKHYIMVVQTRVSDG